MKKRKKKSKPVTPLPPSEETAPAHSLPRSLNPSVVLCLILLVGAVLRIWGITDRHFNELDTSYKWDYATAYQAAWQWIQTGANHQMAFADYCDLEFGTHCIAEGDGGKALSRLLRAAVILVTGDRSTILHSLIDVALAISSMALMLFTCRSLFGTRITILSGLLWLLCGSQFIATGRGYDYSLIMFCATLAWVLFMRRKKGGRTGLLTFCAGVALGAGLMCHGIILYFIELSVLFVILFNDGKGVLGRLKELALLGAGLVVPVFSLRSLYALLSQVTGYEWVNQLWANAEFAAGDGGSWLNRVNPKYLANDWFVLKYLNGAPFMIFVLAGLILAIILHFRRYRFKWSLCNNPMAIPIGVAAFGFLAWGCYYYKCPRTRVMEVCVWPLLAAVAVHYSTSFVCRKFLKGRGLFAIQLVVVAAIMISQWPHTEPMFRMGSGIRKAMIAISGEGKTAYGEGGFAVWPCTMSVKHPIRHPPLSDWEYMDDFLEENSYDYFWANYGLVASFIITYPGAGNMLMLDTYNRLLNNYSPVWRFEYGAPYHAILEQNKISWIKQFKDRDTWKKHHPETTQYDAIIVNIDYFDVYKTSDFVQAYRESKVQLLAQLIALKRRNPGEFNRIAGRFWNFLQYNSSKEDIMQKAVEMASRY